MNRCPRIATVAAMLWLANAGLAARADDAAARAEITAALTQWQDDFNAGRADRVCDLFARELRADFRGIGQRGYEAQCDLLRRSLADPARRFSYALAISDIQVWGDTATVLLTWTLTVRQNDTGREIVSVEPGLDVFRRERDGRWRIVRYMAYEQ
jgi:steroid delta-isomerase